MCTRVKYYVMYQYVYVCGVFTLLSSCQMKYSIDLHRMDSLNAFYEE